MHKLHPNDLLLPTMTTPMDMPMNLDLVQMEALIQTFLFGHSK